jgi:hypothetical protein
LTICLFSLLSLVSISNARSSRDVLSWKIRFIFLWMFWTIL